MYTEALVSCKEFIARTIQTKDGVLAPPDGTLEEIYPWGAGGAMAEVERRRLRFQEETTWGSVYRAWHNEFLRSNPPNKMALIGVSGQAEQVQFVLSTYPHAEIVVIEIDPKKVQAAREAVKSDRVSFINADATEYLPGQKSSFDYIEADKVAIHLRSKPDKENEVPPRHRLYQAIETALIEGGIFHKSDIHAKTWRVCADPNFADNPATLEALDVLNKLMPVILDLSWLKRGALLWERIEDMTAEPIGCAPRLQLMELLTRRYEALPAEGYHPEGMVSQLIAITPALGIEARRRQQPDNKELGQIADKTWAISERFIQAVGTPGVQIALPDYNHFAFRKK